MQLPLTSSAEELKEGCICMFGHKKRCSRKRAGSWLKAYDHARYERLLDKMTIRWDELSGEQQQDTCDDFAKMSVCTACEKIGKVAAVSAAFQQEKAVPARGTPSRRQRAQQATPLSAPPPPPAPSLLATTSFVQPPAPAIQAATISSAPLTTSPNVDEEDEQQSTADDADEYFAEPDTSDDSPPRKYSLGPVHIRDSC